METAQPSTVTIRTVESSVPEAGSELVDNVHNFGQEVEVPAVASSNEANTEKGATSTAMRGETLEMEEEKNSSQSNCCFGTRLLEKTTPNSDRRKKTCTIVLVAVLAVVNLIVCSLPTVLYFSIPVSAYLIHAPGMYMFAIPVRHHNLERTQS